MVLPSAVGLCLTFRWHSFNRKKYRTYDLIVDHDQDDKAKEIKLSSSARPHMRIFHCAWWSVFVSFFVWFSINPLLPEISESLKLSKSEVWTTSIASTCGTVFIRFLLGPLCDKYGARRLMAIVLCLAAIPTACTGFIQSAQDLVILRLCISIAGGCFVMNQVSSFLT
jgi:MFS transporter, NNP family, nitrate/nitrite transporter